jgi:plasmid stabilization system protein ParE
VDYQVIIGRLALQDLAKIHHFIARENRVAAQSFTKKLLEEAKSLAAFPQRGGHFQEKIGARFIVKGPYLIVYRVLEAHHEVRVLRFWHAAREWRRRRL